MRHEAGGATLTLTPRYLSGGYSGQAVVPQIDVTSVNHLVIKLNRVTAQGEEPVLTPDGARVEADLARSASRRSRSWTWQWEMTTGPR